MTNKLSSIECDAALKEIPDWISAKDRNTISRQFTFDNFNQAFAFMTRVAMQSEKLNHHPDWSNSYRTLDVVLTTHSAGGLSGLDIKLAKFMDNSYKEI